jgi:hypothetical protein
MFKNHIDVKLKHKKFIKKVCETKIVYSLENEDGIATSSSNDLEDENGEPIGILCFWGVKDGWKTYEVLEINLVDFMENWCVGIDNDGLLIGTNFDQNMFGFEIEGYDLILELIDELKTNNTKLDFQKFQSLEDFETQVKEAIQ